MVIKANPYHTSIWGMPRPTVVVYLLIMMIAYLVYYIYLVPLKFSMDANVISFTYLRKNILNLSHNLQFLIYM